MASEKVEVVKGAFEAWERGEISQVLGLLADDFWSSIEPTRTARPITARRGDETVSRLSFYIREHEALKAAGAPR